MKKIFGLLVVIMVLATGVYAGNDQRRGQAGASELLINPWARSSGFGGANSAYVRGVEALQLNVAGLAFTHSTELEFTHTNWLVGTDIGIYSFGLAQRVGETGVLGLALTSVDYGEIPITTVDVPEGNLGTFHPTNTIINVAYAKEFSNSIYGGANIKIINESISDLKASGVAIDAGIQYVTGIGKNKKLDRKNDNNLVFGIAMKNWGPPMRFRGDGMSIRATLADGQDLTLEQRSQAFELPSLLRIGAAYIIPFQQELDTVNDEVKRIQYLTVAATFTSNAFTKDQYHLGLEYSYKDLIMVRVGYVYEKGLFNYDTRTTVFTGPSAGISINIPLNKEKGSTFSLEYSYRDTNPFQGVHSIGAKVSL